MYQVTELVRSKHDVRKLKDLSSHDLQGLLEDLEEREKDIAALAKKAVIEGIVRKLKERNYDPLFIMEITDLDLEEIEKVEVNELKLLLHKSLTT